MMMYIILAKPVAPGSKSFLLCFFGTSNKFRSSEVLQRWECMEKRLSDAGIETLGYSSDGNSRLLKSMRMLSELPLKNLENSTTPTSWKPWFSSRFNPSRPICIQDTVHLVGKLRTRLLKKEKPIKIGKKKTFYIIKHICWAIVSP
jgi:hypothetical protein